MLFARYKFFLLLIVFLGRSNLHAGVIGEGLLWGGDFGNGIYTIDPSNGVVTKRLDVNVGSTVINDLAFDRNSGLLYGISGGSLFGAPNTLFTIDLNSSSLPVNLLGTVAPPDAASASISGLTFVNNTLIASQWNGARDAIFSINTSNLSVSNVYYLPTPANFNILDLANPIQEGKPLALQTNPNFFQVGFPSGSATLLGSLSEVGIQWGMAYAHERNRIYTAGGDGVIREIDPVTFASKTIGANTIVFNGLEYVPFAAVPEPSSLAIWSLMTVCAYVSQRRRTV